MFSKPSTAEAVVTSDVSLSMLVTLLASPFAMSGRSTDS